MSEAVWYMEDLPPDEVPVVCFGELCCKNESCLGDYKIHSRHFVAVYSRGWMLRANYTVVDAVYAWSPFPGIEMRRPKEKPKTFAEVLTSVSKPIHP